MTAERHGAWEEQLLAEVAAAIEWPPTPELRTRVVAAIATRPAARRPWARPALVFAAAAALALALLLAVEPARTSVAEFFGLVEGDRIEFLPTPAPGVSPTALPTPIGIEETGVPSSLEALARRTGFEHALPEGAGDLEGVYLVGYNGFAVGVLQYERLDLWQARGTDFGAFGKNVPQGTIIETPRVGEGVDDGVGYWIESGGHIVRFFDAEGREVAGSQRTVDRNTLIWRGAETFYRLETDLPLEDALAIARSLP